MPERCFESYRGLAQIMHEKFAAKAADKLLLLKWYAWNWFKYWEEVDEDHILMQPEA